MKKIEFAIALVATMAFVTAFSETGTTRYWTGNAGNNDWTDSGNYNESGVPDPAAEDTLVFPSGAAVTLDGDDDASCNIARHLFRMKVADGAGNVVLTVSVPENKAVEIDGAISPSGKSYSDASYKALKVVKKGSGALNLNSNGKVHADNGVTYGTDYFSDFVVEEGVLRLPLSATTNMYVGCFTVSNGASVFLARSGVTICLGLFGEGMITNDAASAQTFRVDGSGKFYGSLCGNIQWQSRGKVMLRGTNSTMSGPFYMTYNQHNNPGGVTYTRGVNGLQKIGRIGEPSSIGYASSLIGYNDGSVLLYLGDGEWTDKTYQTYTPEYVHVIDGGEHGGLKWEGEVRQRVRNVKDKYTGMAHLILTGSNSAPCEVYGPVLSTEFGGTNYTFHISKTGTGVWHMHHNDATTMTGGFTVHEGTLRFDTIAEKGQVTSLGKATNLGIEYFNLWRLEENERPYAHTLGNLTAGTTGTIEYRGETNSYSSTRPTVISGTGVLKQSGTGALHMTGFSPLDSNNATLVLDGENTSASNVVADVTDSSAGGVLSVVKRGGGTWTMMENTTFTGQLSVEAGTLIIVRKPPSENYTWFRWTWQERLLDVGNAKIEAKTIVMPTSEFALYDAAGNRVNLNLSERGECVLDGSSYYYHPDAAGMWFGKEALNPGEATIGKTDSYFKSSAYGGSASWEVALPLGSLFDGRAATYFSGYYPYVRTVLDDPSTWVPIVMRLPEGSAAVKYWDYANPISTRSIRISKLEGSVDGLRWEDVDSFDTGDPTLPDTTAPFTGWQFKEVAIGRESESTLGAPGREIRGTSTNNWACLSGKPQVSVAAGATLKAEGGGISIGKLKVDAAGAGTIDGFEIDPKAEVDVVNLTSGAPVTIPATFANTSGLDGASGWEWTFSTASGRILQGTATVTSSGIHFIPMGLRLTIR